MSDDRIKTGIEALRAGRNRDARRIFNDVVRMEPTNAAAWWYLSAVTDEPTQKVRCLEEVVRLEPGHTAAIELLRQLAPRVRTGTPARGTKPPILNAIERTGNQIAIGDSDEGQVNALASMKSPRSWAGPLILAVAFLAGMIWVIASIQSGFAFQSLELATPTLAPTPIPLIFGVPECLPNNNNSAVLIFVNETGMELDLMRGPRGREEHVGTIPPHEQMVIETLSDVPVRYAIRSMETIYDQSGAIIQISAASSCRVTLNK